MKYFGEFLVSKGIITLDQLLDALFQQSKAQPSAAEIAFNKKLISSEQILQALKIQFEKQVDFKSACQQLGIWTNSLDETIRSESTFNHLPLGQILVKSGAADLTTLTKASDEFFSKVELPKKEAESSSPPLIESQVHLQDNPSPSSEAQIDPIILDELTSALSQEKLDSMRIKLSQVLKAQGSGQLESLRALILEIHTARGLLRWVQLGRVEALVANFEDSCIVAVDRIEKGDASLVERVVAFGTELVQFIDDFLRNLMTNPSEKALFLEESRTKKYNELLQKSSQLT